MHHAQRRGGAELDGEVAVAHAVQAVLAHLRHTVFIDHAQAAGHTLAVQRVSGASEGGAAQGQAVGAAAHIAQAFFVAGEHLDIGQQVVRKAHGLCHLQMREAG